MEHKDHNLEPTEHTMSEMEQRKLDETDYHQDYHKPTEHHTEHNMDEMSR